MPNDGQPLKPVITTPEREQTRLSRVAALPERGYYWTSVAIREGHDTVWLGAIAKPRVASRRERRHVLVRGCVEQSGGRIQCRDTVLQPERRRKASTRRDGPRPPRGGCRDPSVATAKEPHARSLPLGTDASIVAPTYTPVGRDPRLLSCSSNAEDATRLMTVNLIHCPPSRRGPPSSNPGGERDGPEQHFGSRGQRPAPKAGGMRQDKLAPVGCNVRKPDASIQGEPSNEETAPVNDHKSGSHGLSPRSVEGTVAGPRRCVKGGRRGNMANRRVARRVADRRPFR